MLIPNVFNQTGHKLSPLYRRDEVLDFVLLSPDRENLLVYGSVDDDNVNGTTRKSVKLVKVKFSNQCDYVDTNGRVPLNTTHLDAKLLSVVPYVNANYSFYYVAEARGFSVVRLRRGVANSSRLFIEKTLEMVKVTGTKTIDKFGCEFDPAVLKPKFIDKGNGSYCLTMICKDALTFRLAAMGVVKSWFFYRQLKIPQITKK
ncbi:hypothetical protein TKK_0006801 [Trichogramma kaykai]